jgi:hypothetical protein
VVAPQAPDAAQPEVHEALVYGATSHEPFEQVEVRATVEHAAPDGADDE